MKTHQEWNESFGADAPLLLEASSLGVPLSVNTTTAGDHGDLGDLEDRHNSGTVGAASTGISLEAKDDNNHADDAHGEDDTERSVGGIGVIDGGIGERVSPSQVAEALRYLARRAREAEMGESEAAQERGGC